LFLAPEELPDHLCVVLEFASTQTPEVAKAFLGEMAHILNAIFSALLKRESPYAVVVAAVLELTGHKAQAVVIAAEESLDDSWSEPEAFDGCSTRGQARPGDVQPIHFVKKAANHTPGVSV
jgi:nitrate reductase delta subunit